MSRKARLRDSHDRIINYLRISITDRCNLRCVYCMPEEGVSLLPHDEVLTFEEIARVAQAAVRLGVRKLRITGGEPLVRKGVIRLFEELIKIPGIEDFGLTTNGILLADYVDALWDVGLRRINISLDTLSDAKFKTMTRGGDINRVLSSIDSAVARGFSPIKINVVAFRGFNDDEVHAFGQLALEKPLHVRFIEHMPMEHASIGPFLPEQEILRRLSRIGELVEIHREDPGETARRFKFKGGAGEIGLISPITNKFCEGCNRLRLNADGMLQSCLLGNIFTDIKTPLRHGASIEELMDVLREAAMKKPGEHTFDVTGLKKCARAMPIVGG